MFVCNLNSSTGIDLEFFYFLLPAVCCFFFNAFIEIKLSEMIGSDFASTKDFFKFSISERYVSYTITDTRFFRSTCSNSCSYTFIKGSFAISFVFFSASSSLTTQIFIRKKIVLLNCFKSFWSSLFYIKLCFRASILNYSRCTSLSSLSSIYIYSNPNSRFTSRHFSFSSNS